MEPNTSPLFVLHGKHNDPAKPITLSCQGCMYGLLLPPPSPSLSSPPSPPEPTDSDNCTVQSDNCTSDSAEATDSDSEAATDSDSAAATFRGQFGIAVILTLTARFWLSL